MVLGLRYEEFSWDCSKPSREDNLDCLPCLFIQFGVVENGARVSKMLQVFSRQATLMDTLINSYVSQLNSKTNDDVDNGKYDNQSTNDTGKCFLFCLISFMYNLDCYYFSLVVVLCFYINACFVLLLLC